MDFEPPGQGSGAQGGENIWYRAAIECVLRCPSQERLSTRRDIAHSYSYPISRAQSFLFLHSYASSHAGA